MVEPAPVCLFGPRPLSLDEAKMKLSLYIEGYPPEEFKYIEYEDITPNRYFITSYGRVFTVFGRELFPIVFHPNKASESLSYLSITLTCTGYIKNRRFLIHRLVATAFIPKTEDDIKFGRDYVNHKYNRDGFCNFVWNLEWTTNLENYIHSVEFDEPYDPYYFNSDIIVSRKEKFFTNDRSGENGVKTKISEHQAHLICYAYTQLSYSVRDCAIYAWLEPTKTNLEIVRGITSGYTWHAVSGLYGIPPKYKNPCAHPSNLRPEKKEEYDKMVANRKLHRN